MTANVMLDHHAAMQTTLHKQQSSTEAIWFARFLSRKSRKTAPGPGPLVTAAAASTPVESPPVSAAKDQAATVHERPLTSKTSAGQLSLAPTTSASQTLASKRSFGFMARRKPSTPSLQSKTPAVDPDAPRTKSAAYVPRHAAADFSQVAIPTTYRDSYASMYSAGSDRPPVSSTMPPLQTNEPRRHASVGNVPSDKLPTDARHTSVHRPAKGQRSAVVLTETEIPEEDSPADAPHDPPLPSSLYEKYVSDGQRQHHRKHKPHGAMRVQSTPDIRAAAKTSTSYAKYRAHQQQHAPQNIIFTVAECDREASRPSSAATAGTTSLSLHPPPSQCAPPRTLRHRESNASISTHRSGRGSTAGSIQGEHVTGIASFGRKLSEYIKPGAISEIRRSE